VIGELNVVPVVAAESRLSIVRVEVGDAGILAAWLTSMGARLEVVETTPLVAGYPSPIRRRRAKLTRGVHRKVAVARVARLIMAVSWTTKNPLP